MKIALITPTRGDRKELLDFCKKQVEQMVPGPYTHIIVDYKPKSSNYDLVTRVRAGIDEAMKQSCDVAIIVEDDDYYPPYFLRPYRQLGSNFYLAGDPRTIYYQLPTATYRIIEHRDRASLFTTAINLAQWDGRFKWPAHDDVYLDLALWRHAKQDFKVTELFHTGAIGIKHGIGLCGGNGHRYKLPEADRDQLFLRNNVSGEAFEFYRNITWGPNFKKPR